MASRLRHFIRLQNIFHSKILNRDRVVSLKFLNAHFYGTAAKSKIFFKGALIVGGLSATTAYVIYNIFYVRHGVTGGLYDYRAAFSVYGYLAAPTRKDRFIVPLTDKSDYIIRHEIPDIKASREVQPDFLFKNKIKFRKKGF